MRFTQNRAEQLRLNRSWSDVVRIKKMLDKNSKIPEREGRERTVTEIDQYYVIESNLRAALMEVMEQNYFVT